MKKTKLTFVGLRKTTTIMLWTLLVGSVLFGVYKNFTAIDQHTVHEETAIKTKLIDTNFISSYVKDFSKEYFSWEPDKDKLEERTNRLKNYFNDELQALNNGMIRSDIPTRANVQETKIWQIEEMNSSDYQVLFSVVQQITEGEETKTIESAYKISVKTANNQIVISSNPKMASLYQKLEEKTEVLQDDLSVVQSTKDDIKKFLETFFKVYPTAERTELMYYADDPDIKEIGKNYTFSKISSINYFEEKNGVKVKVVAEYLDSDTKAIFSFDYELSLKKTDGNWKIQDGI